MQGSAALESRRDHAWFYSGPFGVVPEGFAVDGTCGGVSVMQPPKLKRLRHVVIDGNSCIRNH